DRQAGLDHRLTRRVLAAAGGQYLAEDDLVDHVSTDADANQEGLDDGGTQIRCSDLCEGTSELANSSARGGNDDDVFHGPFTNSLNENLTFGLLVTSGRCRSGDGGLG